MRSLALDPVTGDLAVSGGRLSLVSGADAVAQRLRGRLGLWRGEWVLDRSVGVPYLGRVLGKIPESNAAALLREVVSTCPGVASVEAFDLRVDGPTRAASLTVRVITNSGEPVTLADFSVGGSA